MFSSDQTYRSDINNTAGKRVGGKNIKLSPMANNTNRLFKSIAQQQSTSNVTSQMIGSKRGSQASLDNKIDKANHLGFVIPKGYTQKEKRQAFYLQ